MDCRRGRCGLSLLELMLGMFILFLTGSILAGFMVSSYKAFHRTRERTIALFVAQQLAEDLFWEGPAGAGVTDIAGFGWDSGEEEVTNIAAINSDGDVRNYSFLVTGPSGLQVEVHQCRENLPLRGLTVGNQGGVSVVAFADDDKPSRVHVFNDGSRTITQTFPPMPRRRKPTKKHPKPPHGSAGLLFMTDDCQSLFAVDKQHSGMYEVTPMSSNTWPVGDFRENGGSGGFAGTATATDIWYSPDEHYIKNSTSRFKADNDDVLRAVAPSPQLIRIRGLAHNPLLNELWACDAGNLCLRRFNTVSKHWDATVYRPQYPQRLGVVRGIGCLDGAVYVVDGVNLWRFDAPSTWTVELPLPPQLQDKVTNMAVNTTLKEIWLLHRQNELWRCKGGVLERRYP